MTDTIYGWSQNASDNSAADETINWAEFMPPSAVNDSARALMKRIAELLADLAPTRTSTGSGNAYVVSSAAAGASLRNGESITFIPDKTNTSACTIDVDGRGAKPWRPAPGVSFVAGNIQAGVPVTAYYLLASDEWVSPGTGYYVTNLASGVALQSITARLPQIGDLVVSLSATVGAGRIRLTEVTQAFNKADWPELNSWLSARSYPWGSTSTQFTIPAAKDFLRFSSSRSAGSFEAEQYKTQVIPSTGLTAASSSSSTTTLANADQVQRATSGGGAFTGGGNAGSVNITASTSTTTTTTISGSVTIPGGSQLLVNNTAFFLDLVASSSLSAAQIAVFGFPFAWDTGISAADPGAGRVRGNNAVLASITEIYISNTDSLGASLATLWAGLSIGSLVVLSKVGGQANRVVAAVSGTVTAGINYYRIPVTVSASSGVLASNDSLAVEVCPSGVSVAGPTGASGPVAIDYTWDTGTTAADPGSGKIRASVGTFAGAFTLYINESDRLGNNLSAFIQSWDDSTSTIKGTLELVDVATPTNRVFLKITGSLTDNGSYDSIPVTYVSGATSFSAVNVALLFFPSGDAGVGPTGPAGPTGTSGPVAIDYTWDTGTTAADPGAGKLRASVATFSGSFNLYINEADRLGVNLSAFIQSWDDSTNTTKGTLELIDLATPANRVFLNIYGAITDNGAYDTIPVTYKSGATSFSAVNVCLLFTPAGDKGTDGAGAGTVTDVSAGSGLSTSGVGATGGSISASGTLTSVEAVNPQTGTTYTVAAGDHCKLVTFSNSASQAVTLPQATGSFAAGWFSDVLNLNSGVVTITPTTSTINGATTVTLSKGQGGRIVSDGTNYSFVQGNGVHGVNSSVASASTCDIGAASSNRVSITGTTTILSFGSVPNQIRFGTFLGVLTLTHNATTLILPGGSNITTASGDAFIASSDSSGNWAILSYQKANGQAITSGASSAGGNGRLFDNLTVAASVAASALTVSIKTLAGADPSAGSPIALTFRSATESSGSYDSISQQSALSLTISSGSKVGASDATPFALWLAIFNDGGTARLGLINCWDATNRAVFPLSSYPVLSSTAEGGAGAADSAHVFYTGSAVTSKAYVVIARLIWGSGLTTAGTWASAPTRIELLGPMSRLPGTVIQTKTAIDTATSSVASTTFGNTTTAVSITPTDAANIVYVSAQNQLSNNGPYYAVSQLTRGGTAIGYHQAVFVGATNTSPVEIKWADTPGTTSSTTYTVQIKSSNAAGTAVWGPGYSGGSAAIITATEIIV